MSVWVAMHHASEPRLITVVQSLVRLSCNTTTVVTVHHPQSGSLFYWCLSFANSTHLGGSDEAIFLP